MYERCAAIDVHQKTAVTTAMRPRCLIDGQRCAQDLLRLADQL